MARIMVLTAALGLAFGATLPQMAQSPWRNGVTGAPVRLGTCKSVSSCEEAVVLWCSGYRRADADGDGIPCETVCSSREEVDEIRARIGC